MISGYLMHVNFFWFCINIFGPSRSPTEAAAALTAVGRLRCSSTKGPRTPLWRSETRARRTANSAGLDRRVPLKQNIADD